jgi:hypothetical protein
MAARGASAPAEVTCRRCGQTCIEFVTDYGLTCRLDGTPLPIDTDLRSLRRSGVTVWVLNPENGCWAAKFGFARDWRDTRIEHRCTTQEKANAS